MKLKIDFSRVVEWALIGLGIGLLFDKQHIAGTQILIMAIVIQMARKIDYLRVQGQPSERGYVAQSIVDGWIKGMNDRIMALESDNESLQEAIKGWESATDVIVEQRTAAFENVMDLTGQLREQTERARLLERDNSILRAKLCLVASGDIAVHPTEFGAVSDEEKTVADFQAFLDRRQQHPDWSAS